MRRFLRTRETVQAEECSVQAQISANRAPRRHQERFGTFRAEQTPESCVSFLFLFPSRPPAVIFEEDEDIGGIVMDVKPFTVHPFHSSPTGGQKRENTFGRCRTTDAASCGTSNPE